MLSPLYLSPEDRTLPKHAKPPKARLNRVGYMELVGLRPLTAAESRSIGRPNARRYTSLPRSQHPTLAHTMARETAEKQFLQRSFRSLAKERKAFAIADLARSRSRGVVVADEPPPTRYQWYRGLYLDRLNMERSAAGLPPMTGAQLRSDPTFRQYYKDLKTKNKKATGRLAKALVKAGLRSESWTHLVGDTDSIT